MLSQCLLYITPFLLILHASCQHLENDMQQLLLHDTDVNYKNPPRPTANDFDFEVDVENPPKEFIAVDDAANRYDGVKVEAGTAFVHPVVEDAFVGKVWRYELGNAPSWLSFDSKRKSLVGVPLQEDLGIHNIEILALTNDRSVPAAKYTFPIEVIAASDKRQECRNEEVIQMTLLVAVQPTDLSGIERVKLIEKISAKFGIDVHKVHLSNAPVDFNPFSSDFGLDIAGPGDANLDDFDNLEDVLQVSWVLGCKDQIGKRSKKNIETMKTIARNGALKNIIGAPVIGWYVGLVGDDSTKHRVRRQADDYEYEYSGDEEFDYSNYDEFFQSYDNNEPSSASPIYREGLLPASPEPQPGSPHSNYVSPVLRPVPISTPVYIPVKPTVVQSSPTVTETYYTHPANEVELESSLNIQPTPTISYATPVMSATSSYPTTSMPPDHSISYGIHNLPPAIDRRIQKIKWIAGHLYRMPIPENAFSDPEDGGTRNLTINLFDENGHVFNSKSWILFEPTKQEIYALPLEENLGIYKFKIQAFDREGSSVSDDLEISVVQDRQVRNFNHNFTVGFKLNSEKLAYQFTYILDWKAKAIEKIAKFFGDPNIDNINVRDIIGQHSYDLIWTNTSLIDSETTHCPESELLTVFSKMQSKSGPSVALKKAFLPEFNLSTVNAVYLLNCDYMNPEPEGRDANLKPDLRNQVDNLTAVEGVIFKYKVPDDTCYDFEDGNFKGITMRLLTSESQEVPASSWLQFDYVNREFFGLPLLKDLGRWSYVLECSDSGNKKDVDSLIVLVKRSNFTSQPSVKFSITVNMEYSELNAEKQVKLISDIAHAFGDHNASNIYVESVEMGSVIVTWHNVSLNIEECPREDMKRLREVMTDENGILRREFKDSISRFNVTEAMVIPYGVCLAGDTPTYNEFDNDDLQEDPQLTRKDEDYLLTFIIPAIIIAVMLLLAALIACCLYRKRRYGKMNMVDDRTFVSKGIPIIFAEELDDQRTDNAKNPVIMKEEKPPLPPPEYQKNSPPPAGYAPVSSTPPRMDRRRHISGDANSSADDTPYHPPPPFTATNGGGSRNQRPNLPPAYRKPPTYVPP